MSFFFLIKGFNDYDYKYINFVTISKCFIEQRDLKGLSNLFEQPMLQILSNSPCAKDSESYMGQENSGAVNMPQFTEIRRRGREHIAHIA